MNHWFNFVKDFDRNTTKSDYKEQMRWLRITRNTVESKIDMSKLQQLFSDLFVYGCAKIKI